MHNSTEKCKLKKKIKKSDLNFKKSDFFDFFLNHDFLQPWLKLRTEETYN